jgi:HK97 family phage major capsid protein
MAEENIDDVKKAVEAVMTGFEAFKTTNDARLKEIETKGAADPVTTDKLAKIETTLVAYEGMNQKLTLAAAETTKIAAEQKALKETFEALELKLKRPGGGGGDKDEKAAQYKAAFDAYCRHQPQDVAAEQYKTLNEYKALVAQNDTLGGYYLSPAEMANEIIKAVVLQSPMRSLARVTPIGVASLKLPKRTGTFAATRVGEIASRTETTGYTTGQVEIFCPEMYAEVHISEQMIEDSMFDIQAEMQLEFAEQFAVKEGAEFINGTGAANTATGFLDTSNTTVNTVNSGAATVITGDGIISLFYTGLKTAYAKNATFVMNRTTLGSVRKLKDGMGNYLWMPGIAGNIPNTILGAPYAEMPDMPLEGAGLFPIAVGDWQRAYRVVDRVLISVLRDPFTQSGSGQILFRARKRVGGGVTLGEAIAKLKCSV